MAIGKYHEWLEPDGLLKLEAWARDGLKDVELAAKMGINVATLYDWKNDHPEIAEALKKGKDIVDVKVENALLKRALGYKYDEVTQELRHDPDTGGDKLVVVKKVTKEVLPDVGAQIFWLKNRRAKTWRDKPELSETAAFEKLDNVLKEMRNASLDA